MGSIVTDKEIKDLFEKIERDGTVFLQEFDGYKLYPILRFQIEMKLREQMNLVDKDSLHSGFLRQFLSFFLKKRKFIFRKRMKHSSTFKKSNFLFVGTSAIKKQNGESAELDEILAFYKNKGELIQYSMPKYEVEDFPLKNSSVSSAEYLDTKDLRPVPFHTYIKIGQLIKQIQKQSGISISSSLNFLAHFLSLQDHLSRQLQEQLIASRPNYIFTRSYYTEPWIGMAAQSTDIEVVEIQHGLVGPNHIYYQSFEANESTNNSAFNFPDYILALGRESARIIKEMGDRYHDENCFVLGSSGFPSASVNKIRESKRVVFVLQGSSLGGIFELDDFIKSFLNKYEKELRENNFEIVIRPHPVQLNQAKNVFIKHAFLEIEDPIKVGALESILNACCVISATSFCLYEAISLGVLACSPKKFSGMNASNEIRFFENEAGLMAELLSSAKPKTVNFIEPLETEVLNQFLIA